MAASNEEEMAKMKICNQLAYQLAMAAAKNIISETAA